MIEILKFQESHRERLEKCIAGETVSQPPVALWRHFPVDDQSPDRLAAAITNYQKTFDFDLIKITPASSYCLRDWGLNDTWSGNPEGTRVYSTPIIQQPEDWNHLKVLDPKRGFLGNQLKTLGSIIREFSLNTPILQTIFNPMAQAKNLAGQPGLLSMMRDSPQALHEGLKIITESTIRFIEEASSLGLDGIFLAVQHAQSSLLTENQFDEFCSSYDLELLKAASSLWVNMVHIHGEEIHFDRVARYPAQVLNWHDKHTPPNLLDARKTFDRVICGGLRRVESLVLGTPETIQSEAFEAIHDSEGKKFILGTGCVVPITAPFGNIVAVRNSVFPV
jgi:uroporphyrinogen decarboxylase